MPDFDARRAEIVTTAADLFDESRYYQVSMEDIARANGLSKPTLYHYFKGKEEILFLIHEEFIDLLIHRHESRATTRMTPTQELLEFMSDIIELMHTHHGHVRVFFEHFRDLPAASLGPIKEKRDRYFGVVRSVVERGVEQGEFQTADIGLATLAIFGMCNWSYLWYRPDGPLRPREIAYHLWGMALHGLQDRTPSPALETGDHVANNPPSTT